MIQGDWITTTASDPCVACGKNGWCSVSADGAVAICRHASDGAKATKKDKSGTTYHVHLLRPNEGRRAATSIKPKVVEPASVEFRDQVYRAVLAELALTDAHRSKLIDRGLSSDDIDRLGYRSFPAGGNSRLARELHGRFGDRILGVPGFFVKSGTNGDYMTIAATAGLAIPVRDVRGRIVGLKVRVDDQDVGRIGRIGRYFAVSSGKHGGSSPGTPIHAPLGTPTRAACVRLTEGELKADVAFTRTGIPTVSAPGCSVWRNAIDIFIEMKPTVVRVAFDMDSESNPTVAQALLDVWAALTSKRFIVEIERWDPAHKGIDDAVVAGAEISVLCGEEAIAFLRGVADHHGLEFEEPTEVFTRLTNEESDTIYLSVGKPDGENRCRIAGVIGDVRHEDRCDPASSISRARFIRELAGKAKLEFAQIRHVVDAEIQDRGLRTERAQEDDDTPIQINGGAGGSGSNQATKAFEIAMEGELWHTSEPDAYATIDVNGHRETWRIKDTRYKRYLELSFYERFESAINAESLSSAIRLAEAAAISKGALREVFVRVGSADGRLYLDLCNENWEVIEIDASGWRLAEDPPIRFRRSRGMLALPRPKRGGSANQLAESINISKDDLILILGWLVNAYFAQGPYPILAFFAQQGSGKSLTTEFIRSLVDPNKAPLRGPSRSDRDIAISASNSWLIVADNLSQVPQWLSDAMCRLATGGGMATRELFSDRDETILEFQRPQMITSVVEVAENSDLLDRCLIISLPTIPEDRRRPESEIRARFEANRAKILGSLLDAVVGTLRDLPRTHFDQLPRMADFAIRAVAAERSLGYELGSFMRAYEANRETANSIALEQSVVAASILNMLEEVGEWSGSSTELLTAIEARADDRTKKNARWPKDGRSLSVQLDRMAPNFARAGWTLERSRDGGKSRVRRLTFRKSVQFCVRSVRSVRSVRNDEIQDALPMRSDASDASDAKIQALTDDSAAPLNPQGYVQDPDRPDDAIDMGAEF